MLGCARTGGGHDVSGGASVPQTSSDAYDVIVIGGGNAGLCAALAAREAGGRVLLVERAPEAWRGGNSHFTGGAFRFPYRGIEDVMQAIPDLSPEEQARIDVGQYTEEQFFDDIARVTEYRSDPELVSRLVRSALPTIAWMRERGVRFALMFGRQSFLVDGKYRFWGGLIVEAIGAGADLVRMLFASCQRAGVEVVYEARAEGLLREPGGAVTGVRASVAGVPRVYRAKAVVLACGGFEANPQMRAAYLGPDWDLAKVRGTPYNTGDGIRMALEVGAQPYGHWSGCHAVAWDANAPAHGDRRIADLFQKHSYPFGVIVNRDGRRFVDEGADFRNYTYAKYGREILKQPGHVAFQLFDQKVLNLLRDEYRIPEVTKAEGNTWAELAERLEIDPRGLEETMRAYNAAVVDGPFNPAVKDGKHTEGITPPKSNWAQRLDQPPFVGYAVTCGITFTFGGLRINPDAEVLDTENRVIPGLYACGELVGGLFYHNYPGGSGLMAGSVFGRLAGAGAGAFAARAGSSG
jgi:tricarballylate dehydrogenase